MPQLAALGGDGGHPLLVAIAQGVHPDAAGEVDVLPPRQAVQGGPLPVVDVHRETGIGVHNVGVVQRLEFLKGHGVHAPSFFIFSQVSPQRLVHQRRPRRLLKPSRPTECPNRVNPHRAP